MGLLCPGSYNEKLRSGGRFLHESLLTPPEGGLRVLRARLQLCLLLLLESRRTHSTAFAVLQWLC